MLGGAQLGVGGRHQLAVAPGQLEQLLVLGQAREAIAADTGLARAHEFALAAQAQVDLGQAEAVGVLGQRPQARGALGTGGPQEVAQRGVLTAADPAPQLVQLGDPEALGVLDQHQGRIGHVDPDLDHGRRDQDVGGAA